MGRQGLHRTPFTAWTEKDIKEMGVELEVPRGPLTAVYPVYDYSVYTGDDALGYRMHIGIRMHALCYGFWAEPDYLMGLYMERLSKESYERMTKASVEGKWFCLSDERYDKDKLFTEMQMLSTELTGPQKHSFNGRVVKHSFLKFFHTLDSDIVMVTAYLKETDMTKDYINEDIVAIKRMINSIRIYK